MHRKLEGEGELGLAVVQTRNDQSTQRSAQKWDSLNATIHISEPLSCWFNDVYSHIKRTTACRSNTSSNLFQVFYYEVRPSQMLS
jgi:hypothetical protein